MLFLHLKAQIKAAKQTKGNCMTYYATRRYNTVITLWPHLFELTFVPSQGKNNKPSTLTDQEHFTHN